MYSSQPSPQKVSFTAIREINNLIQLAKCKNVVDMHDSFLQDGELVIVLEFCEYDLSALLSVPNIEFALPQAKYYLKQVLEACHQCHSNGLMHRDVKAANVLINREGLLKLADLGLMTTFDRTMQHSSHVVTLWYRAPELLLGEACYGPAVDLWSVGCVMVELFTKHSPFPGRSEPEQLDLISQVCGTPTEENYPGVEKAPLFGKLLVNKPQHQRRLRQIYASRMSEEALDLLEKLLTLDPRRRIKAQEALRHPFFTAAPAVPSSPPRITSYESIHEYQVKMKRKLAAEQKEAAASAAAASKRPRPAPAPERETSPPSTRPSGVAKDSRPPSAPPSGHSTGISPTVALSHSHQPQPSSHMRAEGFGASVLRASSPAAQPRAAAALNLSASGSASQLAALANRATAPAATPTPPQQASKAELTVSMVPTAPTSVAPSAIPALAVVPPPAEPSSGLAPAAVSGVPAPLSATPSSASAPVGKMNPYLMPARKRSQIAS